MPHPCPSNRTSPAHYTTPMPLEHLNPAHMPHPYTAYRLDRDHRGESGERTVPIQSPRRKMRRPRPHTQVTRPEGGACLVPPCHPCCMLPGNGCHGDNNHPTSGESTRDTQRVPMLVATGQRPEYQTRGDLFWSQYGMVTGPVAVWDGTKPEATQAQVHSGIVLSHRPPGPVLLGDSNRP